MPVNTKTLRVALVAIAAALLVAVIGFYAYARYRVRLAIHEIPKKLGVDVQQSASGFKISKSEGGRMLFSISASSAVQYKGNEHAQLHDARIIVYNHGKGTSNPDTDVYDQIYGKQFDYNHATGEVKADGEVLIDLQAKGVPPDDPAETTASPSALHLKTSGLSFNEKNGIADTSKTIEFALPQGRGSAQGATYDSKLMTLHLKSDVRVHTSQTSSEKKSAPVTITADNADIFDQPREAILSGVHVEDDEKTRSMNAARLTILLRDDNTIEKAVATEGVSGSLADAKSGARTNVQSQQAEMIFGAANNLKTAFLIGAVKMDSKGGAKGEMQASAGKAELEFAPKTQLTKVRATQQVALSNSGGQGKQDGFAVNAAAIDFFLRPGNRLDRAVTSGTAQVVLDSKPSGAQKSAAHTVATADKFEAIFASEGGAKTKMESVHGTGNTKVVSSSAGNPARVTTGRDLVVKFDAKSGQVASVEQSGDFKYEEGPRNASADRASLDMAANQLTLIGSPRVQDLSQGFTLTATNIKLNNKSGDMNADGEVKASYSQTKNNSGSSATPNSGSVMFSTTSGDPVHATSQTMTANKTTGIARFIGKARLWQGANLVEAPQIIFDKDKHTLTAEGQAALNQVQTAFVETDKKGKVTPVSVTAGKLVYSDNDRKARFEGGVRLKTAQMTMVAAHAEVFLKAKSAPSLAKKESAGQVDRIEAAGGIMIEQQDPVRKVTGSRLIYTSDEGKFVITGEPGKTPSIFDAERGTLTGDSLTFYIHDDRVQVGSGENSRIVTRTRIKDEPKP